MTNLILYIRFGKINAGSHLHLEDNTVYVDAVWYRKLCNRMGKSEWELDKHIHEVTQCQYFSYKCPYTNGIPTGGTKWGWNEQEQRYK